MARFNVSEVNFEFISYNNKFVIYQCCIPYLESRGSIMKHQYGSKHRKDLRLKMASVFSEKIHMLSTDLQEILLDDLVTAFENRLAVLTRKQSTVTLEVAEGVKCETF
jgi:rRNA-processing protein FCF1